MKNLFFTFSVLSFLILTAKCDGNPSVSDPYQWMEVEDSTETQDWLGKQDCQTTDYFEKLSCRENIRNELKKIYDFDFVDVPKKYGDNTYFFSRQKGHNKTCLYFQTPNSSPILLIDPESLDSSASLTDFSISPNGSLIAYGLSKSGSDWEEWHIRDLQSNEELTDCLNGIKFFSPEWGRESKGLYYFNLNHSALFYHELGQDPENDQILYQSDPTWLLMALRVTEDSNYLIFSISKGANDFNGIMCKDLKNAPSDFFELFPLKKSRYKYVGSSDGRLYFLTTEGTFQPKIISVDPKHPEQSDWIEHLREEDTVIEEACLAGNKIIVSSLKNACSQIKIYHKNGNLHHQLHLPAFGTVDSIRGNQFQKNSSEFFYSFTNFIHPTSIYCCDAETGISEIFAKAKVDWEPEDYEVQQVYYPSKDGVKIPMFIAHKKGIELNGNNPTLLFGYGGFGISITPSFQPSCLAWLNMGGVYASANIRGGGEYGEEWHLAGKHKNKQRVFDDFLCAASWLHENGYCNPSKLAINGRSNGGLLVGACLVQKPDLFKAAIISVGVLDMLRFHRFTVGWLWTSEFGSPNDPEDFNLLQAYSPYHQVKNNTAYPSTLITTADHDNRVVPCHSYKFSAALQAAQSGPNPILLRVYQGTGHGKGKSLNQKLEEDVDFLSFLFNELEMGTLDEKTR